MSQLSSYFLSINVTRNVAKNPRNIIRNSVIPCNSSAYPCIHIPSPHPHMHRPYSQKYGGTGKIPNKLPQSLAIETWRYQKPPIPPEQRLCTSCNNGSVDDEYHFITQCQEVQHFRKCLYETAGKYNTQFHNLAT